MLRLFTNNANSTLAAGISSTASSLSLVSGGGALFPSITLPGQNFTATLVKNGTPTTFEIINVTGRTTDTFTSITRGLQNSTALSWDAGDYVYYYPTYGDFQQFAQIDDLQTQAGNYAVDTGTASAYQVELTPPLTANVVGLPIRVLAAHVNNANATFNCGGETGSIVFTNGGLITAGAIDSGVIFEVIWSGNYFVMTNSQNLSAYLTSATAAATYETIAAAATTYAPKANPTLTGNVTIPTLAITSNTDLAASTAFAQNLLNAFLNPAGTETKGSFAIGNATAGSILINYGLQTGSPGGAVVVSFDTQFPTVCVAIVATAVGQNATIYTSEPQASTTEFTLVNGASGSSTSWIAIGY